MINDTTKFNASINDKVKALAADKHTWNTKTAVALFVFIVDEYFAQLKDGQDFDADAMAPAFERYANLNAVYNRLRKAKLIEADESTTRIGSDLI